LITQLLTKHWGVNNFVRWLEGIQGQYTLRRDFFVDAFFDTFDIRPATPEVAAFGAGLPVMTAYLKSSDSNTDGNEMSEKYPLSLKTPLFSFIPPSSGMFVWVGCSCRNRLDKDANMLLFV